MRNIAQRWVKFHNEGSSPHGRSAHTMASDGTRVFVHGGCSKGSRADEISLIHVFDTSMYFPLVISPGRSPRLRTQRTSSTRISSPTLSIPMRTTSNLRGSHPRDPRPRSNSSTRDPLHRNPTVLSVFKTPPSLYRAAVPPRRLLTCKIPVRVVGHCNLRM